MPDHASIRKTATICTIGALAVPDHASPGQTAPDHAEPCPTMPRRNSRDRHHFCTRGTLALPSLAAPRPAPPYPAPIRETATSRLTTYTISCTVTSACPCHPGVLLDGRQSPKPAFPASVNKRCKISLVISGFRTITSPETVHL